VICLLCIAVNLRCREFKVVVAQLGEERWDCINRIDCIGPKGLRGGRACGGLGAGRVVWVGA